VLTVRAERVAVYVLHGASISVNGVCLTGSDARDVGRRVDQPVDMMPANRLRFMAETLEALGDRGLRRGEAVEPRSAPFVRMPALTGMCRSGPRGRHRDWVTDSHRAASGGTWSDSPYHMIFPADRDKGRFV